MMKSFVQVCASLAREVSLRNYVQILLVPSRAEKSGAWVALASDSAQTAHCDDSSAQGSIFWARLAWPEMTLLSWALAGLLARAVEVEATPMGREHAAYRTAAGRAAQATVDAPHEPRLEIRRRREVKPN
jgi:hypothetical protein